MFIANGEQQGYTTLVNELDKASRSYRHKPELWQEVTGKTLDELWNDYAKNSAVSLSYK